MSVPDRKSARFTASGYELSNHLGNVLTTVTGRKLGIDENNDNIVDNYDPEVVQAGDYYPFGAAMPGRSYNNTAFPATNEYRLGFNDDRLVPLCSGNRVNDFTR